MLDQFCLSNRHRFDLPGARPNPFCQCHVPHSTPPREHRHQYPEDAANWGATRSVSLCRDNVDPATDVAAILALDARTGERL